METAESSATAALKKRKRTSKWLPLAASALAAGLIIGLLYYGLHYFRSSAFSDERAFRVLREMTGQFGNFQSALAGLLTLVPADAGNPKARDSFLNSLSLEGQWQLRVPSCSDDDANKHADLVVDTQTASRDFTIAFCQPAQGKAPTRRIELSESLARQLPTFMQQTFFEVVVLSLEDGTVLTSIPQRNGDRSSVQLHRAGTEDLLIATADGLLQDAIRYERTRHIDKPGSSDVEAHAADGLPHPIVFTDTIAGETYRVFVQPFEPNYPLSDARVQGDSRQSVLYLIGLKRQDLLRSMADTLGSTGALSITLIVLLGVLSWPLLSLKFCSPQEPLAPTQVFAAIVALLLIPAVIAVSSASMWSRHRLMLWADQAAEVYAKQVESELLDELREGTRMLDHFASEFARDEFVAENFEIATDTNVVCIEPERCSYPLRAPHSAAHLPPGWSPLRSVAPLNLAGNSAGLTINLFGGPAPVQLSLRDREYFRAIAAGEEWLPGALWSESLGAGSQGAQGQHGFVAQRLFNRSDAARVLQIAAPIQDAVDRRVGVITADSRAYALTSSVRPPLLRFAVIERDSAVVLFHSDDSRSLAENLLIETEHNASLREAMRKRASRFNRDIVSLRDHFRGSYLGEPHRFFYRPVAGVPWGVVVFYSTESLADIVLQTAVATLATFMVFAGVAILILGLVAFTLPGRPDLDLLAVIWPKWDSRERYRGWAVCSLIVVLTGAIAIVARLNFDRETTRFVLLGSAVIASIAIGSVLRYRASAHQRSNVDLRSYEKSYVGCLLGAMCAISVVPVLWLASDYHDVSVASFMRSELRQAAGDLERRYRVIARDLERLMENADLTQRVHTARALLDTLPVPGFRQSAAPRGGMQWTLLDMPPGPWLRRCGPPQIGTFRTLIWMLSTSEQTQRTRRRADDADHGPRQTAEEARLGECANERQVVRAWRRSDDDRRIKLAIPLRSQRTALQPENVLEVRYSWSSTVLLLSILAASFILLTLMCWHAARRLFGIRIPFAGRFVPKEADALRTDQLLDAELELLDLKKKHSDEFTWKDECDWRAARCNAIYASAWMLLKPNERLLMHQLAAGYFANPENTVTIENLLRRGYLKLWPWPRIVEAGFAEFIRSLDDAQELAQLQEKAAQNIWHRIRTPLLIVVIVIAGLLMWLAGSAMQILSATLAGIAALFSSISQVSSFANRDGTPKKDG